MDFFGHNLCSLHFLQIILIFLAMNLCHFSHKLLLPTMPTVLHKNLRNIYSTWAIKKLSASSLYQYRLHFIALYNLKLQISATKPSDNSMTNYFLPPPHAHTRSKIYLNDWARVNTKGFLSLRLGLKIQAYHLYL